MLPSVGQLDSVKYNYSDKKKDVFRLYRIKKYQSLTAIKYCSFRGKNGVKCPSVEKSSRHDDTSTLT